ncbi:RNA polymerase sigma factor [Chondromyces apiculatus]|uniref:RNA polymerase sigma-54 factor RpoN n=1 Tax=Chondromyces apiculatus DSM 436 TaxID=1192034 RepID=A0A017TC12_9BACT|nr:RNA polymerase sigma factor [Chondromyces apiculatus]EYF06828.1 RNA polymerase sigma-54 factor RpoN [Chondromyces apiculatus DSM 436]
MTSEGVPMYAAGVGAKSGRTDPTPLRTLPAGVLAEVIRRAQTSNRGALDELTRLIRPQVERQLARYPVSEEDRLDLVQSTLLQVVRTLGSFRGDSSFTTWLFRVTANEALMLMRSQRRQRARVVEGLDFEELGVLPTVRSITSEDDAASLAEREAHVREALGELPEDYRDVVMAHYHEDLGLQEIARKLAVSESAVRSRLHRARVRLRAILSQSPAGREIAAELAA